MLTLVETIAAHQVARGDEVHVLAPLPALAALAKRDSRIVCHPWAPQRRPSQWRVASATLRVAAREIAPDVAHLHSFFPGIFGRVAHLPPGVRVVYQPHSWAFTAAAAAGRGGERAVAAWERRAWHRTDAVVVNCHDELAEGGAHGLPVGDGRGHVVGLPVDTERYHPSWRPPVPRRPVLLCVGRLCRQKGQEELAAAWEEAPIPDATLVLLGAGDPRAVRAAARHTWGGSLRWFDATDDVRPWLHASDVLVMASRYEGQSVAMAEALACGLPVVTTEVNGVREAVAPLGRPTAGAVVGHGDLTALLDACRERLVDPSILAREREAARARAVELFDVEGVLGRLDRAYARDVRVAPPSALRVTVPAAGDPAGRVRAGVAR
ncbi:hypothetical protein GCM10023340_04120 [Nocardioides marinquilinus]|uniref:Glycosyltransferase subfamily 4-like N-terminal domain-containing protein n=1 Tax=Nocardioides marinquilinus TaxID=1210400 RepID=A0ABP9P7G4_9ACTN